MSRLPLLGSLLSLLLLAQPGAAQAPAPATPPLDVAAVDAVVARTLDEQSRTSSIILAAK